MFFSIKKIRVSTSAQTVEKYVAPSKTGTSAAVEAALAEEYKQFVPLVVSSGVCRAIGLTIFWGWKPASRRTTSTGYLRKNQK